MTQPTMLLFGVLISAAVIPAVRAEAPRTEVMGNGIPSSRLLLADGRISKQEARKIALRKRENLMRRINSRISRFEARKAQLMRQRANLQAQHQRTLRSMKNAHEAAKEIPASNPTDNATFDEQFAREMNQLINRQQEELAAIDRQVSNARAQMEQENAADAESIKTLDAQIDQLSN